MRSIKKLIKVGQCQKTLMFTFVFQKFVFERDTEHPLPCKSEILQMFTNFPMF